MRKFTYFFLSMLLMASAASADVLYKGKYVKQTTFDGAGVYLLANGDKSFSQLDAAKTYGYMPVTTLHFQGDDILASAETDAARLTFNDENDGFSLQDASGRYIAMKGTYNSFNVFDSPQENYVWTVTINADGTASVTNFDNGKTIMLGISYGTWGSYPEANDDRALPTLYKYVAGDEEYTEGDDPGDDPEVGDGTKDAPLTVAQLAAHEMNSAKVWVKGYIVGSANGSLNKTEFGAAAAVATNLVLADAADCTDVSLCIPVQLPSGAVRAALNLLDNPGNLGKLVTLYGTADKYFSVPGLKNVSDYVLDTNGDDPGDDPELEQISIGEFLAKADTKTAYILKGKVSDIKNTTYGNFNLVEGTDTIYIYGLLTPEGEAKQFESMGIEEGDVLTLSGKYVLYNDTPEIKNATYISHEKGTRIASALRAADQPVLWFDLTGKRIAAPTQPGLYIKTIAGKTVKTIVR